MKIKEGFMLREVAGSFVVVAVGKASKNFKGVITLNETGAFLFKKLYSDITKEELIALLLNEYSVSEEIATNDVNKFVNRLIEAKIIE